MEEECEVGPKNLRSNFRFKEIFLPRNVSHYLPMYTKLIMSTSNFSLMCVGIPVSPKAFLYLPGI